MRPVATGSSSSTRAPSRTPDHIHVLNDAPVVVEGVRSLGSILWTDFALFGDGERFFAMQMARQRMTDFSLIHNQGKRFTPEDAARLHMASKGWLASMLAESFDGRTVVATHHAPSSRSVHPRYAPNAQTADFRPDLIVDI